MSIERWDEEVPERNPNPPREPEPEKFDDGEADRQRDLDRFHDLRRRTSNAIYQLSYRNHFDRIELMRLLKDWMRETYVESRL